MVLLHIKKKRSQSLMAGTSVARLVPRSVLFGRRGRESCQLSPDGRWLSWLAPVEDVCNVWIARVCALEEARPLTKETRHDIASYTWSPTSEYVLYLRDCDGDENFHLFAAACATGVVVDLTPIDDVRAILLGFDQSRPDVIAVGLNQRDPAWHDVYRVNVRSGERELVLQNDQRINSFLLDRHLNPRIASRICDRNETQLLSYHDGAFQEFMRVGHDDYYTTSPLGFNLAGDALYMRSSVGRDTAALIRRGWPAGDEVVLISNPRADVVDVVWDPTNYEVQAACIEHACRTWVGVGRQGEQDVEFLRGGLEGQIEILSATRDNGLWLVAKTGGTPAVYWTFNRVRKQLRCPFPSRPDLQSCIHPSKRSINVVTRDGLDLVGYVVTPALGGMETNKPLPMVVTVHGGPWWRDSFQYDVVHHWLADRGYAVLTVNFRGSKGFGKRFVNAGDLEWGGRMLEDILDGVEWAIESKFADRDRLAIMGESYGGYTALSAIAFAPKVFRCAIALNAPSNLQTLIGSAPPYWAFKFENLARRVGDPRTEAGRALLRARSPVYFADRIKVPLLLAQGENDVRVRKHESEQIVAALQRHGHS